MLPFADPASRARARSLRNSQTDVEGLLWSRLRRKQMHGLRFRRQTPIGQYIADFACLRVRLIVEIDGSQHSDAIDYDVRRSEYFRQFGFRVLRFTNRDVLVEFDNVLDTIWLTIDELTRQ